MDKNLEDATITADINNDTSSKVGFWACTMWALGALFYCYEYYLRVAPSVMTSDLALAFKVNATSLGSLSACYYYAYTIMQVPVGILMDKYGPRFILTLACLICALGTFLFAATDILAIAGLGRFLVGFGSAFAYVGVLKLTSIWLPKHTFAMFAGFSSALGMLGAISGDLTMTWLVESLGWQQTIHYSAVAGVLLTLILWLTIKDPSPQETTQEEANCSADVGSLAEVFKNPQMWINGLYGFLVFLVITGFAELWGIPFLRDVRHFSPQAAAWTNSMIFFGFAIGGPILGWFSDKIGLRRLPMLIGALGAAITISMVIYLPSMNSFNAGLLLFLAGFFASSECIVFAVARDNNAPNLAGTAAAFTNMLVMMGGVILQPLIGKVLDMVTSGPVINGLKVYSKADYKIAFIAFPLALLLGALILIFMQETNCDYISPKHR